MCEVRAYRLDDGKKISMCNQNLCCRVVDDEFHFWSGKTPVDINRDRIDECTSVKHFEMLDAVLVEKGDTILCLDASTDECIRHACRTLGEFSPGARAGAFDEGVG